MAVSADSLQALVEEIYSSCERISLFMAPQGYIDPELTSLSKLEGKDEQNKLKAELDEACQHVNRCSSCNHAGQGCTHDAEHVSESEALRFSTSWQVNFKSKQLLITKGGFTCGCCRALMDVKQFVHFNALHLDGTPERQERILDLHQHFAVVNGLPAALRDNGDMLAAWLQELYSRAYALQVVASNISGWTVAGPDGQPLALGKPGTTLQLVKTLLKASTPSNSRGQKAPKPAAHIRAEKLARDGSKGAAATTAGTARNAQDVNHDLVLKKRKQGGDLLAGAQPAHVLGNGAVSGSKPGKKRRDAGGADGGDLAPLQTVAARQEAAEHARKLKRSEHAAVAASYSDEEELEGSEAPLEKRTVSESKHQQHRAANVRTAERAGSLKKHRHAQDDAHAAAANANGSVDVGATAANPARSASKLKKHRKRDAGMGNGPSSAHASATNAAVAKPRALASPKAGARLGKGKQQGKNAK